MIKKQLKEKQQFITFELMQNSLGFDNPFLFKKYLIEVFNDLISSENKENKKFMTKIDFYDYIKLPIFISEKLFISFTKSSNQELYEEEFVDQFYKLYMGSFEETINIIFNLLDFDKDGKIKKEDVKIILNYLPLNEENEEKGEKYNLDIIYEIQMKRLEEIDTIVNEVFIKNCGEMNLEKFIEIVTKKNSSIFLQILCFLYEQIPFSKNNIEAFKIKYNNEMKEDDFGQISQSFIRKKQKSNSIKIKAPKLSTLISTKGIFLKKFQVGKFSLDESVKNVPIFLSSDKNNDKISLDTTIESEENISFNSSKPNSSKFLNLTNKIDNYNNSEEELNIKNINIYPYNKNNDIINLNNENYIRKKSKKILYDKNANIKKLSYFHINIYNKNIDKQLAINENKDETENNNSKIETKILKQINKDINYENWIYKKSENGKLTKLYLVLVKKDIYYYKSEKKNFFVGMNNLSGCLVEESPEKEIIDGNEYYSFVIYYKNILKTIKYYTNSEEIYKEIISRIKKSIGFVKFSDLYEIKEEIGKGKFGLVNLGIQKETGQKVAIKILNKKKIKTIKDKELIKFEIGILNICHHPNIIRLLDHLEDKDYIYIITEYIEGGTLEQYFKKMKFKFNESQAANIMNQIAKGIKYLQQYGIVHRDLKPNNIMLTKQNEYGILKILDFGLSKIVSSNERMLDGYGTLSYVAPEILLRTPYNKEVDIWSLGIILFYMINGKLPFRGKKEKEVAEKIAFGPLEYDEDDWETLSQNVQDLIFCCLQKKKKDRIIIEDFINHPWFKKNMKGK